MTSASTNGDGERFARIEQAARIITDELRRALDVTGDTPMWMRQRQWPGRVAPDNDAQLHAAILTLITHAEWPCDETMPLRLLGPLYRTGWCTDAIIYLLEHEPDGTKATPEKTTFSGEGRGRASLDEYLQRRLDRWRYHDPTITDHSTHIPHPSIPAATFQQWAERMRTVHGDS